MNTKSLVIMNKTRSQGIEYAAVYDREFYMSHNPNFDLENMKDEECFEHFLCVGMVEGKAGSASFDPIAYSKNYPELNKLFGKDNRAYYYHYLEHGMRNGLSGKYDIYHGKCYRKIYDVYYYQEMNPDIYKALGENTEKYIEHFVEYGMNEGRMACETFDVHAYKYRYERNFHERLCDLKSYYMHYMEQNSSSIINGMCSVYGNVDYASVYSYAYYKANNSDIRDALGNNASLYIQHFVEHGMEEGRNGNGVFDVLRYKSENPQLLKEFGDYLPLYYLDYIKKK